ncbi:Ig-like domain repeat protein [uncultured Methanobrevibacter sp.]|uniref:Ig-like domain repeat protein n=2 Tax=uncultured Methanobrevibacter sp. TaxID=253161 RepID=UPI0025DDC3D8|nr:Ig-like domain repeat protein [uncultured Methanobrevibacter sp.]
MKRIFLIFLIFMLSLGVVSASDLNDTDILADSSSIDVNDSSLQLSSYENDVLADEDGGEFIDVSHAYDLLNEFRREKGAWYWMGDDLTKAYFNTIDTNQIQPLIRDSELEETAKIRAKELSLLFSHTRPDGTDCSTAFPEGIMSCGENIAAGQETCEDVTEDWKESLESWSGQGHRRNMLATFFNCVGIAAYKTHDGEIFWAQDFGLSTKYPVSEVEPVYSLINLDVPDVKKGRDDFNKKLEITLTDSASPISNAAVEININGINYTRITDSEGKAFVDVDFAVGVYKAVVEYGNFSATSKIKVVPITVIAPDVTSVYGNTELVVTLTNDSVPFPHQELHIWINDYTFLAVPTDDNGIVKVNLSELYPDDFEVGVYEIPVFYLYDYSIAKVTVNKCPTSIDSFNWQKLSRNSVYINATVLPISSGKMIFKVNEKNYSVEIKDSVASLTLSDLAPGNYSFAAAYNGDGNYESSTSLIDTNFTSEEYRIYLDVINVTMDYGADERLAAHLYDNDDVMLSDCDVTFNIGGQKYIRTTDSNGYAYLDLDFDADTYDAVVTYQNVSATARVIINPLATKTNLSYSKNSKNVILTALIDSSTATGDVIFNVNGKDYPAKVNGGKATYTLNNLAVGSYSAVAMYNGDVNHNASASYSVSFDVEDIDIIAPDVTKYYHGPERFVVTVKEDNVPVVGKDVTINLNGVPYTRTTDNNGVASMAINLDSGIYNVTSEFGGIKAYSTITVKTTIESKDITKIFRNETQYYATFRDSNGNLLKNTDVNFNINGVFYVRTTDSNGVARMNINLIPNQYVLTAMNPVSGESCGNLITVLPNIVENHDLTKYYKNASKFTFRLLDNQGNPVGAGVSASLNINGVFYTRQTDENGYINMNINLNPGTYIATIMYNGLSLANTIKVLPILEAKDVVMKYRDGTKFEAKLLDGQGKPFTNQTLTFNINGVMYSRVTDGSGIARLNINLMPGEYIITSMYSNGAAISNKVTIRS